jgi:hypothetical protein
LFTILVLVSLVLTGVVPALAQGPTTDTYIQKYKDWQSRKPFRTTTAERLAAAKEAAKRGFKAPVIGQEKMLAPTASPHYFSYANYANSPLVIYPPVFTVNHQQYFPFIMASENYVTTTQIIGGIRKFVNTLAGLGPGGANNLGQIGRASCRERVY